MNPPGVNRFLHSVYHRLIKRDGLYKWFEFYEESQWWPKDKLLDYQWELFQRLLHHAYENVPYYRSLFQACGLKPNEIRDYGDLQKIPCLTKKIVNSNFDRIRAENINSKMFIHNATSGSTGTNFYFYSDRDSFIKRQALQMRIDRWIGMRVSDRELTIWGASWDVKKANKILPRLKQYFKNKLMVSAYRLSDEDMMEYYRLLRKFQFEFLHGYPSILYRFARFLEKNSLNFPLRGVKTAGETLYNFQKETIERVFQTKVFNYYSSREIWGIAQEDEFHDGLCIQAENILLEVIDEAGNPLIGNEGEIVVTDLHNLAFPFIRYRIGDRGILAKAKGRSGRGLPILKRVTGRTFEIITFPNGNAVGGTFWTLLLKSEKGIHEFQVVQKRIDEVTIYVVVNSEFDEKTVKNIRRKILDYSGEKLRIVFKQVESIPLTKGGKSRYVISEIN